MMNNEQQLATIIEGLTILGLDNISSNLTNYLKEAINNKMTIIDFLSEVIEAERVIKVNKRIETKMRYAGFPNRKTFEMFDFDFQPSIDKELIMILKTLKFIENKENIAFIGTPGVGKTHLSIAFGMHAIHTKYTTHFVNCHKLIEDLFKASFENRLKDKINYYARFDLLIIDEIGFLPMDVTRANLFFQLINKRYEKKSTIITTNKQFSQWGDVFSDITIASAILDRFLHHCHTVNIKGDSYRLKERKEVMKNKEERVNTLFIK